MIVFTLYVAEISILNVPCTRRRLATVILVEKSSPGNSRRSWSSKCIITHCVGAESGHVISWHLSLSNLLADTFRGLRRLSWWWLLMSDIILWCVRHFVHLPFAAISRSWCGAGLHLEDHSGGMGGSTGVRLSSHLDQAERWSRFSELSVCWWRPYLAGFVGLPLLQMSRRLADDVGDSAGRLSCVYGGQWKRAFRVNTRVVHSAVLHRPPIGRRSLYVCFTLAFVPSCD